MKCTVIGGQGFIGKGLTEYLEFKGHEVFTPTRNDSDLLNKNLGHVFYCAGFTGDFYENPVATFEAHAGVLAKIIQQNLYESLVYLSSTRLYDSCIPGTAVNESSALSISPLLQRHFFDITKLAGEALCLSVRYGKAKVVRLSCVYKDSSDKEGFLPSILRSVEQAKRGEEILIKSSPHYSRDYVYLLDVLVALENIAINGKNKIYNIASGINVKNEFIKNLIFKYSGRSIKFSSNELAPDPIRISIDRMIHEFKWYPLDLESRLVPWLIGLS